MLDFIVSFINEIRSYFVPERLTYKVVGECKKCGKGCNHMYSYDEYTEKESDIEINKYIYKREKGKRQNEKYDYKFIDDNRVGLLTVRMKLSAIEKDFKTGESCLREKVIKKSMLIPLQDEHGLYYIKGKRYYLIYQMVEFHF